MPLDRLRRAKRKTVGTKQTAKAVDRGQARVVFVASDAEPHVVEGVVRACRERSVEVVFVESMGDLGRACGIEVGAASAAILEE
ncbi:MAG: ribosomal L7Ae/L30e/S12e/Gadd45 family protein [Acetobacteraceae bacterium]|nr:ribosomal L7Ae/L30e/S12e/Gadd45 family protein [Acetobacteraceae bacterium]